MAVADRLDSEGSASHASISPLNRVLTGSLLTPLCMLSDEDEDSDLEAVEAQVVRGESMNGEYQGGTTGGEGHRTLGTCYFASPPLQAQVPTKPCQGGYVGVFAENLLDLRTGEDQPLPVLHDQEVLNCTFSCVHLVQKQCDADMECFFGGWRSRLARRMAKRHCRHVQVTR